MVSRCGVAIEVCVCVFVPNLKPSFPWPLSAQPQANISWSQSPAKEPPFCARTELILSGQSAAPVCRRRLNGYLRLTVPSFFLASSSRIVLNHSAPKCMFPLKARYPLRRCRVWRNGTVTLPDVFWGASRCPSPSPFLAVIVCLRSSSAAHAASGSVLTYDTLVYIIWVVMMYHDAM